MTRILSLTIWVNKSKKEIVPQALEDFDLQML